MKSMWADFIASCPKGVTVGDSYSSWHFCDNRSDADELAALVLQGRKRATAGALWSYEAECEPLPQAGDLSVITDWSGSAVCVIRTTSVEVLPFEAVTEEFAALEGEGDGSLGYWREAHQAAFSRELSALGRDFDPTMPVVCERFELVFGGEASPGDKPTRLIRR